MQYVSLKFPSKSSIYMYVLIFAPNMKQSLKSILVTQQLCVLFNHYVTYLYHMSE